MRLWSLHPKFLDVKGLVALWREGLLAQAVLLGQTRGYKNHPQLERFRATQDPLSAICVYLEIVRIEATRRGYKFDRKRISRPNAKAARLSVTTGQIEHEWKHLLAKLKEREPARYRALKPQRIHAPHPLFRIRKGSIAPWERA